MSAINVLMCGGRRAGKTSILAGIKKNIMQQFSDGSITLDMKDVGRLIAFQQETEAIFGYDYDDLDTFMADQNSPNGEGSDYLCKVHLMGRNNRFDLNFTDVPGEWFVDDTHRDELYSKMKNAHVLIIAVDSPHLIEERGKYHEVFNRAERISNHIKECFRGNQTPRMVLFVPVKSEKYRATPDHPQSRMQNLTEQVKAGYADLIKWLTGCGPLYTVAIVPCFTFGGAEFLEFVPPIDESTGEIEKDANGNPLEDIGIDYRGLPVMQYQTEYGLLRDVNGMHYCKPERCEQPLLCLLLYFLAMSQAKGILDTIWFFLHGWAGNKVLEECKRSLLGKLLRNEAEGFAIINDPLHMLQ